MKFTLVLFSLLLTSSTFANKLTIGLIGSSYSKTISGENAVSGVEEEIVSNTSIHYGLELEYSVTHTLRFIASHVSGSVEFDNSESTTNGETYFDTSVSSAGFKWIVFSRTALRFLYNIEKDIGFNIVDSKAEIFVENSNYLTVFYDQIVFLGPSMYSGFRIGSDLGSSGDKLSNRTATRYGLFIVINSVVGQFEGFFEVKSISKESSSLDFEEKNSVAHLSYRLIF
jgi:hypothetical protein